MAKCEKCGNEYPEDTVHVCSSAEELKPKAPAPAQEAAQASAEKPAEEKTEAAEEKPEKAEEPEKQG